MKASEREIKKAVKQYLQLKGWFIFHILQGLGSYRGISDFIAMKKGYPVYFIEIKTYNGKQSEYQKKFQEMVEQCGHKYLIVKDISDLEKEGI